jgi:hypothetical protein
LRVKFRTIPINPVPDKSIAVIVNVGERISEGVINNMTIIPDILNKKLFLR